MDLDALDAAGPSWTELVTGACAHRDAHLVKYTLACLDAAYADPDAARLFLAGAASLLAFWEALTQPRSVGRSTQGAA